MVRQIRRAHTAGHSQSVGDYGTETAYECSNFVVSGQSVLLERFEFLNASKSSIFKLLEEIGTENELLASHITTSWNQFFIWLRSLQTLGLSRFKKQELLSLAVIPTLY
jgi:hypothetical protein